MPAIKIHVLHTGEVCVAPDLPFGGDGCNAIKASGIFGDRGERMWLPVSSYLIEHPGGRFLVDAGWARAMSPRGEFDKEAQIKSLGSRLLYEVNQGCVRPGACVDEQLEAMGIPVGSIDAVLITHLDCDHANGLSQVRAAKKFIVARDEVTFASRLTNRVRYNKAWWEGVPLTQIGWTGRLGPAGKSYDLLGDGSIQLVNIPGHSDGLFAVKVAAPDGRFALLFSDGGYARRSWEEMVTSGIAADKRAQRRSLAWIREQSLDPLCVESLANHDPDVEPHVIEL